MRSVKSIHIVLLFVGDALNLLSDSVPQLQTQTFSFESAQPKIDFFIYWYIGVRLLSCSVVLCRYLLLFAAKIVRTGRS